MWFFVIAGAAVVDAFATGVWLGKKWGTSSTLTTIGADLAAVEAKEAPVVTAVETDVSKVVSALEADITALRAKVTPAPQVAVVNPAPMSPAALAVTAATLQAQAQNAPK